MTNKKVLVVEDEDKISEVIAAYLKKDGYEVTIARDGNMAIELFNKLAPDMVILDLMLPFVSGEDICAYIRKTSQTPIIMLTAKSLEDDKISGLLSGADDYMTKPFSPRELMARVTALFRRTEAKGTEQPENKLSFNNGDLQIDLDAYSVTKNNTAVNLTQSELKLLLALANRPQRAFTREDLIDIAFDMDTEIYDRTIDSHIKNLRAKIEDNSAKPDYIATIRGIGYKFCGNKDKGN